MSYWETNLRKFEEESDAAIYESNLPVEILKGFLRTLQDIRALPEQEVK